MNATEDYVTMFVSALSGFIDGSFNAQNTSLCRRSLLYLSRSTSNATKSILAGNENRTVYYSTRILKWMHPSAFHCYYAGKETIDTIRRYLRVNSWKDVMYNLVYKMGQILDQVRIIDKVMAQNIVLKDK